MKNFEHSTTVLVKKGEYKGYIGYIVKKNDDTYYYIDNVNVPFDLKQRLDLSKPIRIPNPKNNDKLLKFKGNNIYEIMSGPLKGISGKLHKESSKTLIDIGNNNYKYFDKKDLFYIDLKYETRDGSGFIEIESITDDNIIHGKLILNGEFSRVSLSLRDPYIKEHYYIILNDYETNVNIENHNYDEYEISNSSEEDSGEYNDNESVSNESLGNYNDGDNEHEDENQDETQDGNENENGNENGDESNYVVGMKHVDQMEMTYKKLSSSDTAIKNNIENICDKYKINKFYIDIFKIIKQYKQVLNKIQTDLKPECEYKENVLNNDIIINFLIFFNMISKGNDVYSIYESYSGSKGIIKFINMFRKVYKISGDNINIRQSVFNFENIQKCLNIKSKTKQQPIVDIIINIENYIKNNVIASYNSINLPDEKSDLINENDIKAISRKKYDEFLLYKNDKTKITADIDTETLNRLKLQHEKAQNENNIEKTKKLQQQINDLVKTLSKKQDKIIATTKKTFDTFDDYLGYIVSELNNECKKSYVKMIMSQQAEKLSKLSNINDKSILQNEYDIWYKQYFSSDKTINMDKYNDTLKKMTKNINETGGNDNDNDSNDDNVFYRMECINVLMNLLNYTYPGSGNSDIDSKLHELQIQLKDNYKKIYTRQKLIESDNKLKEISKITISKLKERKQSDYNKWYNSIFNNDNTINDDTFNIDFIKQINKARNIYWKFF